MALISSDIPSFINGVSQQPDPLRLDSQVSAQVNGVSSLVEGLRKRNASQYVAKLNNTVYTDLKIHTINRDASERYIVLIGTNFIKVFDKDGVEKTVNAPGGYGYLSCTSPRTELKTITVNDFTFIVNRTVTTALDSATSPDNSTEGLIFINQIDYEVTYNVDLNGVTASYTSPSTLPISTETAASNLASTLDANANITATASGSVIYFTAPSGYYLSVSSSSGDSFITGIPGKIQQFSSLPAKGVDGVVVRVAGAESVAFDDYYVKFVSGSGTDGTWEETIAPNTQYAFDDSTMPHQLVRESDGTFTFEPVVWDERLVGDENTSPNPSFVGKKINNIFFYRNRLGFLSDQNLIMSEAGEFFNFWATTATTIVDSDPIDISAATTKVSILKNALPYRDVVVAFSDQTQFLMNVGDADILSPETINLQAYTEYESYTVCEPILIAEQIFFPENKGDYTEIRDYIFEGATGLVESQDLTNNCPSYVPNNIYKLFGSSSESMIGCLSSEEPNNLYVYKFFFNGESRIQSSWSKWTFNGTILDASVLDEDLYLTLTYSGDGTYLERIPLEDSYKDLGQVIDYKLDRKVDESHCSFSYNSSLDETTITFPYDVESGDLTIVVSGDAGNFKTGAVVPVLSTTGTTAVVNGDLSSIPFFAGHPFEYRVELSQIFLKEETSQSFRPLIQGRLQMKNIRLYHKSSGYYKVIVSDEGKAVRNYIFTGKKLGRYQLGAFGVLDGEFVVPLLGKNDRLTIEIVNDSFLPNSLLRASWEATYHRRSERA